MRTDRRGLAMVIFENGQFRPYLALSEMDGVYWRIPSRIDPGVLVAETTRLLEISMVGRLVVSAPAEWDYYAQRYDCLVQLANRPEFQFFRWMDDHTIPLSIFRPLVLSDPCGGHEGPLVGRFLAGRYA